MTGSAAVAQGEILPDAAKVPGDDAPVKTISAEELKRLGDSLTNLFSQYKSDRRIAELRWLRNQRQYLGIYDPEIEKTFSANRSQAYPKLTRVKCISVLARIMNLMFPGNEKNWALKASPAADMDPQDVNEAIAKAAKRDQEAGAQPNIDIEYALRAVQTLADERAHELEVLIDDQLEEIGGDQTIDYVALNRKALFSGILYGLGVLRGPFVRETKATSWAYDQKTGLKASQKTSYKPHFEFLPIWDFYPDMSAKTFTQMDGYFTRLVMSRSQVRALGKRSDFLESQIRTYLERNQMGNYRPQPFETELRAMGVKVNVNEMKVETSKYEVICWHGPIDGHQLSQVGVEVPKDKLSDDFDAEIWMIDGNVIKAEMNPWVKLGVDVKTIHTFLFDEDDTSPVGQGLPNVMRDSQMSVAAMTRMLLDNASVTCGPNLEVNLRLMRADQDLTSISPYKIWYRDDDDPLTAQYPAVRDVSINAHMNELLQGIELFLKFCDQETFVGPATGGDMEQAPSEPMRTAAGASMLRGDAALPFKDIIRSFDGFTQSVILSLVQFNRKFNPDKAKPGDYNVLARGATSLIAKEVRGMQIDQLATSLTDEEKLYVNDKKFAKARFEVRDLGDMMVSDEEADRKRKLRDDQNAAMQQKQTEAMEASIRKTLAEAFKNVTQGQKNTATADAQAVSAALDLLEKGLNGGSSGGEPIQGQGAGAPQADQPMPGGDGGAGGPLIVPAPSVGGQGPAGGMQFQ